VTFAFDRDKSAANQAKHGIDFEAAQALWLDEVRLTLPSEYVAESRELVVGRIGDKLWTAAVTYRDEAVRIISVRRARKDEEALYGSENN
jgi:uncharacterized DUF497 family protein